MRVTTIILAHNEEAQIETAIKSVQTISDAILVIDDASTDGTAKTAQAAGATVISQPLAGDFAQQRNFALEQAKTEWVLFLDADEVASPELVAEIEKIAPERAQGLSGFHVPRYDIWQGKQITLGELHTASSVGFVRLVHKGAGAWHGTVHETWVPSQGSLDHLRNPIKHYPHPTVKAFLEEINIYSSLRAQELYAAKQPVSVFQIWAYPLGKFIVSYFFLFGFIHGAEGFIYSFMMSFHSFLVRAKLYQYYHLAPPQA